MDKKKDRKSIIKKLLGNPRTQNITIPIFTILLALVAGAVVFILHGKNPLSAYYNLLQAT